MKMRVCYSRTALLKLIAVNAVQSLVAQFTSGFTILQVIKVCTLRVLERSTHKTLPLAALQ
jgi:hypothetical protein